MSGHQGAERTMAGIIKVVCIVTAIIVSHVSEQKQYYIPYLALIRKYGKSMVHYCTLFVRTYTYVRLILVD